MAHMNGDGPLVLHLRANHSPCVVALPARAFGAFTKRAALADDGERIEHAGVRLGCEIMFARRKILINFRLSVYPKNNCLA